MKPLYLSALLSGLLYVFSFAPWDLHFLQWVAFLPLILAVDWKNRDGKLPEWRAALLLSVVIGLGGFYWMIHATMQYGGLPLPAALLVFAAFCLTGQLQIPFYFLFRRALRRELRPTGATPLWIPLLLGVAYTGFETLYPKIFQDLAGHAFQDSAAFRQLADLGGVPLLTLLSLFVNECLALLIMERRIAAGALAGLTLLSGFSYGRYRIGEYRAIESSPSRPSPVFRLALIQANIGDFLKIAAEQGTRDAMSEVLKRYLDLSSQALRATPAPDAFVWPETAYPGLFRQPDNANERAMEETLDRFLAPVKSTFIFGGYDRDRFGTEYNSLFFHHTPWRMTVAYHKNILLMFGETLPFSDLFPSMKTWFPTMGFFGRGPGPEAVEVQNLEGKTFRFAPSICYEGLVPEHSIQGALEGADALLNVTNDSWFGPHGEPYLHLALTRFRTVETRLPLVRSTNTGISVWMDPLGETRKSTPLFEPAVLQAEIRLRELPPPPFMRIGAILGPNWFVRITQILSLLVLGFLFQRRRLKRIR